MTTDERSARAWSGRQGPRRTLKTARALLTRVRSTVAAPRLLELCRQPAVAWRCLCICVKVFDERPPLEAQSSPGVEPLLVVLREPARARECFHHPSSHPPPPLTRQQRRHVPGLVLIGRVRRGLDPKPPVGRREGTFERLLVQEVGAVQELRAACRVGCNGASSSTETHLTRCSPAASQSSAGAPEPHARARIPQQRRVDVVRRRDEVDVGALRQAAQPQLLLDGAEAWGAAAAECELRGLFGQPGIFHTTCSVGCLTKKHWLRPPPPPPCMHPPAHQPGRAQPQPPTRPVDVVDYDIQPPRRRLRLHRRQQLVVPRAARRLAVCQRRGGRGQDGLGGDARQVAADRNDAAVGEGLRGKGLQQAALGAKAVEQQAEALPVVVGRSVGRRLFSSCSLACFGAAGFIMHHAAVLSKPYHSRPTQPPLSVPPAPPT